MHHLTERDICTKFVTPGLVGRGWDLHSQLREEVTLTAGRIIVRGKLVARGTRKRADYVLYLKPNIPLAVIEVKDGSHDVGAGMQQALEYAEMLGVPFAFSTNGRAFLFHDMTLQDGFLERAVAFDEFPSPQMLWTQYCRWKGIAAGQVPAVEQPYFEGSSEKSPHYYQALAVNRVVEAVSKAQDRLLLVMATGTGKTYTAFQIIWRLWKSGVKRRVLYLADRNILLDQAKTNDFKPFGGAITKVTGRRVEKQFEIYLALYQAVTGNEEAANIYIQFSPDFFDLVIVDECHRGSAAADSAWRAVLEHFSSATHLGMTATPKETREISNIEYFGDPLYTYSLRQGIEDGFLAPYKVIRYDLDRDLTGFRPEVGTTDRYGYDVEDRVYNQSDFDRRLVLEERTRLVAKKVSEFLKATNRYDKTIIFCEDVEHAERMRQAIANENVDLVNLDHRYVMRITGDDQRGKEELDNFIDPQSAYPVIATTSKLLTTGVDAKTCKLIVLDQTIHSATEFKQIIGRGTRVDEARGKYFFTIMDFKRATELFAQEDFDGDPVQIYEPSAADLPLPPEERPDGSQSSGELLPAELQDAIVPVSSGPRKYYVDNVEVQVIARRVQYLDKAGKLVSESLRSYIRNTMTKEYKTLDEFLRRWSEADRKQAIVDELEGLGVSLENLREEVSGGEDYGIFDLVCHVAYDRQPVTRRQRAASVRSGQHLSRYSERAREVLESLLEKYSDEDIEPLENAKVLQLKPFDSIGTPVEIMRGLFGGRAGYDAAVKDLQAAIFREA